MKKCTLFILLGLALSSANAQPKAGFAPLNPEFIKYRDRILRGEGMEFTSNGYSLGCIPHPAGYSAHIPTRLARRQVPLPESYDLRIKGTLTPVKNQGACGSCWTFATLGSVEARWLELGLNAYNLSEQNLKNGHGFLRGHCSGGNAQMSTAYFVRGHGPVSEADDPYNIADSLYVAGLTPQAYIPDARFLPNDKELLKQTVYDTGAIYTVMRWEDNAYDALSHTYYYSGSDTNAYNHSVLLVGWDDHRITAGGQGAWIIKNSWGTAFGENGFFYISYNDTKVNVYPAFWPKRMDYDPNVIIHQYDKLGWVMNYGFYYNYQDYGLVKFVPAKDQSIIRVGTWVNSSHATVRFEIYDNFNGDQLTNFLGQTGNFVCDYPGYYTFDLPSPIARSSGNDFYVKVKYNTPETEYCIPVEIYMKEYAAPVIEMGKCWISRSGYGDWIPVGLGTDKSFDLCIKAYGISTTSVPDEDSKAELPSTFVLYQNRPNPFNSTTRIAYSLPTSQHVVLKVYDLSGREVATLVDEWKALGNYGVDFNAGHLPSGMYVYRIKAGDFVQARKLMLLK